MKSKFAKALCLFVFVFSLCLHAENLQKVRIDNIQTTEHQDISAIDFHYDGTMTPFSYHFQFWIRKELISEWAINDLLLIDFETFMEGDSNRIVKNKRFYVKNLGKDNEAKAVMYKQWEEGHRP